MKKYFTVKVFALPLLIAAGIMMVVYSTVVKQALSQALNLCAQTLIPSLFAFLCLCGTAVPYSDSAPRFLRLMHEKVFRVPGNTCCVFLLSLIGGYPVGPMMCAAMYEQKRIDSRTAAILPLFCCASGPAFSVIFVGESLCGSKSVGYILLSSGMLSQILIALFFAIKNRKKSLCKGDDLYKETPPFSTAFLGAVETSITAMLRICAFVMLFCVLTAFIMRLSLPQAAKQFLCALLEVTGGVTLYPHNIPMCAFLLGFGGVSIIFQVHGYLAATGTKLSAFLLSRLVSGLLCAGICKGLLVLFPQAVPTLAGDIKMQTISLCAPFSAMLIISFAVFILDTSKKLES
ncbi:MAG: hypothetical protein IKE65_09235 [Clostridia bacterium]|nr:hypothetical protein [Clostridia bacterium]